MCLLNQRPLLTEAGRGGHGEDLIFLFPVISRDSRRKGLPAMRYSIHLIPLPKYHMNEQKEQRCNADVQMSGLSSTHWGQERKE